MGGRTGGCWRQRSKCDGSTEATEVMAEAEEGRRASADDGGSPEIDGG